MHFSSSRYIIRRSTRVLARTRLRGPKECSIRMASPDSPQSNTKSFRFALLYLASKFYSGRLASQRSPAAPRHPSVERSDKVFQRGSAQCIACRAFGSRIANRPTLFGENRRSRHAMRRCGRTDGEQWRRGSRIESGSTRTPVIALFFVQKSYKINRAVEKRSNIVRIIKQNEETHTGARSAQTESGITVNGEVHTDEAIASAHHESRLTRQRKPLGSSD